MTLYYSPEAAARSGRGLFLSMRSWRTHLRW